MVAVEPDFGVFGIRVGAKAGEAREWISSPLPDVARHVETAVRTRACGEAADRRRAPITKVEVATRFIRRVVAPCEHAFAFCVVVPCGGLLPFGFGRQTLADKARVSFRLVPTDACDWMIERERARVEHCARAPTLSVRARPVERARPVL